MDFIPKARDNGYDMYRYIEGVDSDFSTVKQTAWEMAVFTGKITTNDTLSYFDADKAEIARLVLRADGTETITIYDPPMVGWENVVHFERIEGR